MTLGEIIRRLEAESAGLGRRKDLCSVRIVVVERGVAMSQRIKWACPKCKATEDQHGKDGAAKCRYTDGTSGDCGGFLCECATDDGSDHGETESTPCPNANCYHCGWGGTFPLPRWKASDLPVWARTALAEGWTAPPGWIPKKS